MFKIKKWLSLGLVFLLSPVFSQESVILTPELEAVKGRCTFIRIYHPEKPSVMADKKPLPVYSRGSGEFLAFLAVDIQDRRSEIFLEIDLSGQKREYILPVKTPDYRTRTIRIPYRKRRYVSGQKKRVHRYQQEHPAEEESLAEDEESGAEESDELSSSPESDPDRILFSGSFRIPLEDLEWKDSRARFADFRFMKRGRRVVKTYFHRGEDFPAPRGTPVYAAQDGVVLVAEQVFAGGKTIILDHGWGITSEYLHLSAFEVIPGDRVRKGQMIGEVGNTGISTGPHLHWGIRVNGICVSPLDWTQNWVAEIFSRPSLAGDFSPHQAAIPGMLP